MDKNVIEHVFLGKGRMNRRQFFYIWIVIFFWSILLLLLINALIMLPPARLSPALFLIVVTLIFAFLNTWNFIRRGHDMWLSSLIMLFVIIIFVIMVIVGHYLMFAIMFWYTGILSLIWLICFLTVIGILLFYPGSKNSNKYGDVPDDLKIIETIRFWWTGKTKERTESQIKVIH